VTPPLRVLQLVRPALGGIRQHVFNLLDGLDPALVTNSVAAPPAFVREVLAHPQIHATIPLDIAPRISPARDLLAARRLAHVLPQFADIVHAHGARAAWIAALAHRHRPFPLVFTAHNLIGRDLSSRLGLPFIGFHCTRVLAVSPAVADSLATCGIPRSKIEIIPNGIDLRHYDAALQNRAAARQSLGVSETAFVVASAARLSREKGLDILLQAAGQRTGMTFLLAGDGPLKAALARQAPPNAKFLGRLTDVAPLFAAADVFAVPSRREGQGISALEAMASGIPLVATRVGGLADMLTDGETALLVPPEDPDALAATLSRLKSDARLRQKLVTNASALVREKYDLAPMLVAVAEVYRVVGPSGV
jgi:glycosyltransferase involved in cell wall biosynthesis